MPSLNDRPEEVNFDHRPSSIVHRPAPQILDAPLCTVLIGKTDVRRYTYDCDLFAATTITPTVGDHNERFTGEHLAHPRHAADPAFDEAQGNAEWDQVAAAMSAEEWAEEQSRLQVIRQDCCPNHTRFTEECHKENCMMTETGDKQARRLEEVYAQLAQSLGEPSSAQSLPAGSSGANWSVTEVLGHLVEMIPYWLNSCQTILAASAPPNFGRALDAPERLAGVESAAGTSPQTLLNRLQREVQSAAAAIRQMSEEERSKRGVHRLRGEMTVAEIVESLIVAHAEDHLAQAQAALAG